MMLLSMLLNTSKTDTLLGIALIALGLVSATNLNDLNDLNDSPASWGRLVAAAAFLGGILILIFGL